MHDTRNTRALQSNRRAAPKSATILGSLTNFRGSGRISEPTRWEFLEGAKAVEAADAIAGEFAKVLAEELRAWPPRLEWTDPAHARRFAPLYAAGELLAPRHPSAAALQEGFRLARWDLGHDREAIDSYFRNDHAARSCPDPFDRLALELTWRWLVEALLELGDRTEGRLKRRHLLDCLERAEKLALGGGPGAG